MSDAFEKLVEQKKANAAKQSQIDRAINAYQVMSTAENINADGINVREFPSGSLTVELRFDMGDDNA